MLDVSSLKLGRKAPRHDLRTFHFADYLLRGGLPSVPATRDWTSKLPNNLGMLGNDQWGDCGFAGMGHAVQVWTSQSGTTVNLTTEQVLAAYSGCTGFNANDPSTDQGVVLLDALNYWRNTGIGGHKIGAYVKVDVTNLAHVRTAIDIFGCLYTGSGLPITAQNISQPWTGPHGDLAGNDAVGSLGGHCMVIAAYDPMWFTYLTWGVRQRANLQWLLDYTDEAYAIISPDWINGSKPAPSGFDMQALQSDLARL